MFDATATDPDLEHPDPVRSLSEDELDRRVHGVQTQRTWLDAEECLLIAEKERRRSLEPSRFRDTAAWYQTETGVARSTARTRVEVSLALDAASGLQHALCLGEIGFDHARIVADHLATENREQLLADQPYVLHLARRTSAEEFRKKMAAWAADLDAQREQGLSHHEQQVKRRKLRRWRRRTDGMNMRLLELDDEGADGFDRAIDDIVREQARAEAQAGGAMANVPIWRRRGDAALELVRRSRAADQVTKHKARPTILAMCDADLLWDQLKVRGWAELGNGERITVQELRRLACEADIVPIIRDEWGVPLDMGRTVRLATHPQRLALRATHDTCAMEGCDVPFDWCEIHHLVPWQPPFRGPTNLENLVPLCSYHHHLVHDLRATVKVRQDKTVVIANLGSMRVEPRRRSAWINLATPPPGRAPART